MATSDSAAHDPECRINAAAVKALVGNPSDTTLTRWQKHHGFPRPTKIASRRYWRRADVLAWLAAKDAGVQE